MGLGFRILGFGVAGLRELGGRVSGSVLGVRHFFLSSLLAYKTQGSCRLACRCTLNPKT